MVAADTLKPLAGALVRLIECPYMEGRTQADGRFHLRARSIKLAHDRETRVSDQCLSAG